MANFFYFVFGVVPDWVIWLGVVTGLVIGTAIGVLGIAIEWRQYRRENPRGSRRWNEGWVRLIDALSGCAFTLAFWLAVLGIIGFLVAVTMYAYWSPALWVVIVAIIAAGVLVDRWVSRPVA